MPFGLIVHFDYMIGESANENSNGALSGFLGMQYILIIKI